MVLTYPEVTAKKVDRRHGANGTAETTFGRDLGYEDGKALMREVHLKALAEGAVYEEEGGRLGSGPINSLAGSTTH